MEKTVNLDIVRIFAAGMVLTVHIGQMSGFDFNVGAKGVQLFFILSGYLAFVSLDRNSSPLRYYKKRLLRILPIYWSCLILLYLKDFLFMLFAGNSLTAILEGQCGIRFLRYFAFLQCCLPSDNWDLWNNHSALWTMSSFMVFYLVAPFLYKMLKRFYSSFCMWIIFLIGTPYLARWIQKLLLYYPAESHIEWFSRMNPLTELYCFMGGATLFIAIKEKKQNIFGFFITGVLIVTKLTVYPYELLFILVILIAVSFESTIKNEMTLKVVLIISRGSFALYLIHPIVLQIATRVWNKANNSTILYAIYLYVMCIAISYILYYGVVIKIERMINDKFIYNADAERYRAL